MRSEVKANQLNQNKMNIGELKKRIADMPDDMDVMVEQTNDESRYGMAGTAEIRLVTFMDMDIESSEWPEINCLVITDDY